MIFFPSLIAIDTASVTDAQHQRYVTAADVQVMLLVM
jgi:hypothetical protein